MPRLDQRITIQSTTYEKSATSGEDVPTWGTFAEVWAGRKPSKRTTRDNEVFKAGRDQSEQWHDFEIRRMAGLTTAMRVIWESSIYGTVTADIRAIETTRDRAEYIDLECRVVT